MSVWGRAGILVRMSRSCSIVKAIRTSVWHTVYGESGGFLQRRMVSARGGPGPAQAGPWAKLVCVGVIGALSTIGVDYVHTHMG